ESAVQGERVTLQIQEQVSWTRFGQQFETAPHVRIGDELVERLGLNSASSLHPRLLANASQRRGIDAVDGAIGAQLRQLFELAHPFELQAAALTPRDASHQR